MESTATKYVVFAPGNRELRQNRVLDRDQMAGIADEFIFYADLLAAAQTAGYVCMTEDVFFQTKPSDKAFLISCAGSGYFTRPKEFVPAICLTVESPITAPYFVRHLDRITAPFYHVFLWRGLKPRVTGSKTEFHELFWPNIRQKPLNSPPWPERGFLVMISGNKRAFSLNRKRISWKAPRDSLAWLGLYIYGKWLRHTDPWMKNELYLERLEALRYFAERYEISLYGRGWDQLIPETRHKYDLAVKKSWRGEIPRQDEGKLTTLSRFKFSLCFENTVFPGYITEKIFDCFFAGTIPIYYGAPDIDEYVPRNSFIDYREFENFAELADFLKRMPRTEAERYTAAARDFLNSSEFDRFKSQSVIQQIISALNRVCLGSNDGGSSEHLHPAKQI